MNIREIAKRARVSTATVSRTINRHPSVQPQLAKRVWKIVEELGYFPNTQARALVSGKSRIFGLIISEITNPFFPEIVQVFERPHVSNIRIDYLHGIRQAVQHLAALRHQRIAFISGPLRIKSAEARQQAFVRSMEEIRLPVDRKLLVE